MKKAIPICLALLMAIPGQAQKGYEKEMKLALEHWDQQRIPEATAQFEALSQTYPDDWLTHYYTALTKIAETFGMTDRQKREKQLEEAGSSLLKAENLKGEGEVELMLLRALWHTGYVTLNPQRYGPELSPVVTGIYDKATKRAPDNPRVVLSKAQWNIGAAPHFGEDPSQYCGQVRKSLALFETTESPEQEFAPAWGKEQAEKLIERLGCKE